MFLKTVKLFIAEFIKEKKIINTNFNIIYYKEKILLKAHKQRKRKNLNTSYNTFIINQNFQL